MWGGRSPWYERRGSGPRRTSHNILKEKMPCGHTGALTFFRMGEALAARTTDCSDSGERRRLGPNWNGVGQETGKALQAAEVALDSISKRNANSSPSTHGVHIPKGRSKGNLSNSMQ